MLTSASRNNDVPDTKNIIVIIREKNCQSSDIFSDLMGREKKIEATQDCKLKLFRFKLTRLHLFYSWTVLEALFSNTFNTYSVSPCLPGQSAVLRVREVNLQHLTGDGSGKNIIRFLQSKHKSLHFVKKKKERNRKMIGSC